MRRRRRFDLVVDQEKKLPGHKEEEEEDGAHLGYSVSFLHRFFLSFFFFFYNRIKFRPRPHEQNIT